MHGLLRLVPCLWKHLHSQPGESPAVSPGPLWTLAGPEAASRGPRAALLSSPSPPPCPGPFSRFPGPPPVASCCGPLRRPGQLRRRGLRVTWASSRAVGWVESLVQADWFLLRPLAACRRCLIPCPHVAVPLCPDLTGTHVRWDQGQPRTPF